MRKQRQDINKSKKVYMKYSTYNIKAIIIK